MKSKLHEHVVDGGALGGKAKLGAEDALRERSHGGFLTLHDGKEVGGKTLPIKTAGGVRYTVPVMIRPESLDAEGKVTIRFRVGAVYQNKRIVIYAGDKQIFTKKRNVLAPGEMETVNLKSKLLLDCPEADDITVTLEDA